MRKRPAKISLDEAREMYTNMEKEILLSSYTFPSVPSTDGYYHIYVVDYTTKSGRRQFKAKTLDKLKDKVYKHDKEMQEQIKRTFRDVFEISLREKTRYIKNPEKLLSVQNTIGRTRSEYKRFFEGTSFERQFIDDLTKRDIETICYNNLCKYNLSKKGFGSMRSILKMTFKLAYEEGFCDENLYERINFSKYNDMLVVPTKTEDRGYSDKEVERILEALQEKHEQNPTYLPAYALELQISMGLRRGEVPPLKWSDVRDGYISIDKTQITVKKNETVAKEYFEIVSHTKTWKDRKFPITSEISQILTSIRIVHRMLGLESEYLFPADTGTGVITNNTVYNLHRRICNKLGIKISKDKIRGTHAFRRNAITDVVNKSGGNITMASQLFGNSAEVAMNHYYLGLDLVEAKSVLEQGNQG